MRATQLKSQIKKAKIKKGRYRDRDIVVLYHNDDCCYCDSTRECFELWTYKNSDDDGFSVLDTDGDEVRMDWDDAYLFQSAFVLKQSLRSKYEAAKRSKKPETDAHHVGVELEFASTISPGEMEILIAEADLENSVTVKTDGSVDPTDSYPFTHELCLIAAQDKIQTLVSKVCSLLRGNSKVNSSCGMHVHLDMRNRDREVAFANLFRAQQLLYAMCPRSRKIGEWCQPLLPSEYEPFCNCSQDWSRFVGINRVAYEDHKTIEVRMHSGTLSALKINNWIKLLTLIVDMPCMDTAEVREWDFTEAMTALNLDSGLKSYVIQRLTQFNVGHKFLDSIACQNFAA